MKQQLLTALQQAVDDLLLAQQVEQNIHVQLSYPRHAQHGDYTANIAMQLAPKLKQKPRDTAQLLLDTVQWPAQVEKTEIAGPGFINIYLVQGSEFEVLRQIIHAGESYGLQSKKNEKVCLEFVSANPTGPMHVGHGRGAIVGDALSRIMHSQGYDVVREYYMNDAGAQIGVLTRSVWTRMCQLDGQDLRLEEGCYPGEYIIDLAKILLEQQPFSAWSALSQDERDTQLADIAIAHMMTLIREDLKVLNIEFDVFFSEQALHASGKVQELIAQLRQQDLVYDGTLPPPKGKEVKDYKPTVQCLFRTTQYGDDVDRALQKQDGSATYFAADIAYHKDKDDRGFDRQINVWGADHGGYVRRVQAAMQALTTKVDTPEVILIQMVNLTQDGKPVRMSKRAGTFVTLREVVDAVGSDAVRFNFLTRRCESQLDFDLQLAKNQSMENPVYYVQYAYARISTLLNRWETEGHELHEIKQIELHLLSDDQCQDIIKKLLQYPEILANSATKQEPYRVATFLMNLASDLHSYYHKHRILGEAPNVAQARLLLMRAVAQVISNALTILGVSAPKSM
ncbi:MAG: arginine--tRNA ligase [Mariprofundaceae bacterium]|nr:arginine--tRNA ligase [Mariprofundaceae bacterium]